TLHAAECDARSIEMRFPLIADGGAPCPNDSGSLAGERYRVCFVVLPRKPPAALCTRTAHECGPGRNQLCAGRAIGSVARRMCKIESVAGNTYTSRHLPTRVHRSELAIGRARHRPSWPRASRCQFVT